jgi:two-component system invasion response regulator UvrY
MTTILLADHHTLFRAGLVKLIESIGGFSVVGEVATAEAAVEFSTQYTPDILLIEMSIPNMLGFEVLRRIKRLHIGTRVVALTHWVDQPMPVQALRAGFDGYLGKDIGAEELSQALYKLRFGKRYISERVARDLARFAYGDVADDPFKQLSVRELQVLLMVLDSQAPATIAQSLHLSPKTVNSYRYRIFDKLQVDNDVALTKLAVLYNVIELGAATDGVKSEDPLALDVPLTSNPAAISPASDGPKANKGKTDSPKAKGPQAAKVAKEKTSARAPKRDDGGL